jgi:hypothetical protein
MMQLMYENAPRMQGAHTGEHHAETLKLQYASYTEVADALQFKGKKRSRSEWKSIIAT